MIGKGFPSKRLISYFVVGGLAFATEFSSFLFLYASVSGEYKLVLAQTLSFLLGLMVSFTGSRKVTFKRSDADYHHTVKAQMILYLVIAASNILLSNVLIYVLVSHLTLPAMIAKVVVMGSVVLWNYSLFSKFVFKTK